MKKKVVIVGGGFGGIKAALTLQDQSDFEVTLISDKLHFEYHAALYRSSTGWSPREVSVPLVEIFDNRSTVKIVQGRVVNVDADKKNVILKDGDELHFDELIIATGKVTNYFGIDGMEQGSFAMNTVAESLILRQHLNDIVCHPDDDAALEFVIVGGGATGVELSAELKYFIGILCEHNNRNPKKAHITLIEAAPRLLPGLAPKSSKYAEWRLERIGVKVMLNTKALSLKDNKLTTSEGVLNTKSVIWTAGISNNPLFTANTKIFNLARNGLVEVDEYMRADNHIYVIGDNALTQFSGMAQTALHDGKFVATNLIKQSRGKRRKLYVPHRPIYAVPVGANYAVIQWGNLIIRGRIAWVLRRIADLRLFISFEPYKKAIKNWRAGDQRAKGYDLK